MKFSIITINYNNREGLQKTIKSVISQTFKDYEWIIIDGGSTDGSKELIEQYSKRFAYWCSESDKGVYNAMNKGIDHATGEYLIFMNSGDVFYEGETLANVFKYNFHGDVVYGDWIRKINEKEILWNAPKDVALSFFYNDNICHQAMFVKASVLKAEGYDESFRIYADWARWVKLCLSGASFLYLPVLICIFDATDGLSSFDDNDGLNKKNTMLKEELFRIRECIPLAVRKDIEQKIELNKQLQKYQKNMLIQEAFLLVNDRPLFCRLFHVNIILLRYLRKMLKILHL